jgi:hypothetical protein
MLRKYLRLTLVCLLSFATSASQANETYWLAQVAALARTHSTVHPHLEDPESRTGDVSSITITEGRMVFNGEWCDYSIEKVKPFKMDRLLSDLMEDMGGQKRLDAFLASKLKTSVSEWREELTIKQSNEQVDAAPCKLLQGASIYRGKDELILWDTAYFYRFKIGAAFQY